MIVLFDFDGVIADTESQYTIFWNKKGKEYLGLEDFGLTIKAIDADMLSKLLHKPQTQQVPQG